MNAVRYSQRELDRKLLDAANCLRGPVDPADFKAYIFPLLFFKRLSDTWRWEHARLLDEFSGDDDLARLPENYRFVIPDGCLWEDVEKAPENLGAVLQTALDRIQEANPEKLAGIFGGVMWGDKQRLPEPSLVKVMEVFSSLQLDPDSAPNDLLGNAYEYLLKNFADESGKKAGEFFTPRAVVQLMGRILEPQEGESICDPACGSGGLLVESVNEVRDAGGDPRTLGIYGQEINQTTAAIARMNLYLHGIETFHIRRGDTLREPKLLNPDGSLMQFDMIVANPPFSLKNWGRESWADDPHGRSSYGVPPAKYGDFAFVEHMLSAMDPETGRMAIIMPHGVLSRGGEEQKIRKCLVESGRLDAVVGLAPNLFYNTPIAACILVCRNRPLPEREAKILFIDGAARFKKGRSQNELTDNDVEILVQAYCTGAGPTGDDDVRIASISLEQVVENDFDLNIALYLQYKEVAPMTIKRALADYEEKQVALREAEIQLAARLREANIVSD